MHDLLIRGANVYDGSGSFWIGDVAVQGGKIVETGTIRSPGRKTHNAHGLALMPGVIDVHTHYGPRATPE